MEIPQNQSWDGWQLTFKQIPPLLVPPDIPADFYLAWAGSLPYGDSKAITVAGLRNWLREKKIEGMYKEVDTLIENTSGNTGKNMLYMFLPDESLGIKKIRLIVKHDLPEGKKTPLLIGGAHIESPLEGMSGIQTARHLGGGGWVDNQLSANGNVLNLDQYGHPAGWWAHRDFTGPAIEKGMLENFGLQVDETVCSIGTGGSLTGIAKALNALRKVWMTAVILAQEQEIPGMRSMEEASPPGVNVPWSQTADQFVEVFTRPCYLAAMWIARTTGCPIGPSTAAAYLGAIDSIRSRMRDGIFIPGKNGRAVVVIFGPDGNGAYGDRFTAHLPFAIWESRGRIPLPWEWNWRGEHPR